MGRFLVYFDKQLIGFANGLHVGTELKKMNSNNGFELSAKEFYLEDC